VDTALAIVIPALIGLVTGAVATAYKSRKDLEVQYDIKLREERIAAYKELWKELARLAYYSPEAPVTRDVARDLSAALRKWYFETGGLLMSEETREPYFDLQRALTAVVASDDELSTPTIDALKQLGSRLRTSTTDDVATRVEPLLQHRLRLRRRAQAQVTVARGWTFDGEASGAWRVRVVNRSRSRLLKLDEVSLGAAQAKPVDKKLPRTLYPGEAWQGFVRDASLAGVDDPFRAGRARGPGWTAISEAAGDPPASPIPADSDRKHATG
jgi:hypothetical protein